MYLAGPTSLKLLFHGFVVLVGVLILAGAQNTAIVGANGVLNRVAEDGVLTSWFQKPHPSLRHQLPHHQPDRCMQLLTIVLEPGQRLSTGRALRLWRDLELHHEVAGRAGAAFHRARQPRMEGSGESSHLGKTEVPLGSS
jgi:hypothetical protein